MKTLSEARDAELPALLSPLADAYEALDRRVQERRIDDPGERLERARERGPRAPARWRARRWRGSVLGSPRSIAPDVAEAFRFANHAMWQQRVHTLAAEARRHDDSLKLHAAVTAADVPENRSWRPFQLAFVLLNLPALADPTPSRARRRSGSG